MSNFLDLNAVRLLLLAAAVLITAQFVIAKTRSAMFRQRMARSYGCQPITKSCNKDPFLGLDVMRDNLRATQEHRALELSSQRHALFGNTYASKHLLRRIITTMEPENIKTILAHNFEDYGIGHRLERFKPLLGVGIFDTDGEQWARSRALIRPNFNRNQVADLTMFEKLLPELLALIPRDGETVVDLQGLFFRYTIDSATEFLFGHSVGSLRKAEQSEHDLAHAFDYAQEAIRIRKLQGPLSRFFKDPKADRCNKICRNFAQQFVDEAVSAASSDGDAVSRDGPVCSSGSKGQKYIFSHELARRISDNKRILDELMNMLLAGRDTTAGFLCNLFFMLSKHPTIWAKLREEVARLGGRTPTYEELRNLKYLRCCMNECKIIWDDGSSLALRGTNG